MPEIKDDQAASLRRMMASHLPKIVTVVSASSIQDQSRMLTDLAATLTAGDCDVLLLGSQDINASSHQYYGDVTLPTLHDVALQKNVFGEAVKLSSYGHLVTTLSRDATHKNQLSHDIAVNAAFEQLASLFDIVLVDAGLDQLGQLPLNTLNQHDILIHMSCDSKSIKQAYVLIKQLYQQLGKRKFGIVVNNASDPQAADVFKNIAETAKNFMQIELEFFGAIPADDHLNQAAKIGRLITEAFPMAKGAKALKALAQRMYYKQYQPLETELASIS